MTKNKTGQIKLIINRLINEEQKEYSLLLDLLKKRIGDTTLFDKIHEVLHAIHVAKNSILQKVYNESQDLDI